MSILVLLTAACATAPAPSPPPSDGSPIVVRQALAGASLEVTLRPRDARGEPIFPVAAHVTRGSVRGPLAARVVASGMSGEVTVRELAVRWDGRDEAGAVPPAGEYVLVLELAAAIDGVERRETIGVVFSLAEP